MESWHILVTGASGYVGGSVLSQLMGSKDQKILDCKISALVRGEEKAKILKEKGINPVLFEDLDATEQLEDIASNYDGKVPFPFSLQAYIDIEKIVVIINAAVGYHEASAKALLLGLGSRKKRSGKNTYFIHTTGAASIADQPITKTYHEPRTFSDQDPDIYAYEQTRNTLHPLPQRQTDLTVIQTGLSLGVKTYLTMPPTIYGRGTGYFNRISQQIPSMVRAAMISEKKEVTFIGDGKGVANHVHVEDLAMLYEVILGRILAGRENELRSGETGIYFAENGSHTWIEVAQGIANALVAFGISTTSQPRSITLNEAASLWIGGDTFLAELVFASNSRTKSDLSRSLGWEPKRGDGVWKGHFLGEVEGVLGEGKG